MITLNGEEAAGAASVAVLLERLGLGADARGIAVAVDGEIVPRSQWERCELADGANVEVVGAVQGG
jgi:sulfur carrier protein